LLMAQMAQNEANAAQALADSLAALADAAGLSQAYIAQIETGKREGRVDAYRAIANVLKVNIDDLV